MTYGRSGSTLLMGILNSIPGWLLRGENRHAMRHLYEFHSSGLRERARVDPAGPPADAPLVRHRVVPRAGLPRAHPRARRGDADAPEPGTRVTGYKEIRWYDEDLPDYLAFLQQVFPGCRFVVNTRHLPDVAASNYWTHKDDPLSKVRAIEEHMLAAAAELGDAAHRVHYDDYAGAPGALRGLFEWLGEDFDEERVRTVMSTPHSRRGKHRTDDL